MSEKGTTSRKHRLSTILKIAIPTVVTVGLCFVLFTGVDFNDMMDVIRRDCNFSWIVLGLALSVLAQVIRAWRWSLQLNALKIYPPFFCTVLSIFGTYAVNIVFPRLGEIWRTGYIAARQKAPFTVVFGSMLADRVADLVLVSLLTVFTFLVASPAIIAFIRQYPDAYNAINDFIQSPLTWGVLAGIIAIGWWACIKFSTNKTFAKAKKLIIELWNGFAVIVRMKKKLLWIFLSFALWGCYFLQLYVTFFAFPFTEELLRDNGIVCPLVCFVLSSIAMGIPSNGGIGPWQVAVIFSLTLFAGNLVGVAADDFRTNVTAYANLVMGMETLLLIVLGIFTFICVFFDKRRHPDNHVEGQVTG